MILAHGLFALLGAAAIGATSFMNVLALPNGASNPRALAYGVLALLLIGGAAAVAVAWHTRRPVMALALFGALLLGEVLAVQWTAERSLHARAAASAPMAEAQAERARALARVDAAQRAVETTSGSARLAAALEAQRAAAAAVATSAALPGCAANCRALLTAQVQAAEAEVTAARQDVAAQRARAEAELSAARAALAALPPSQPVSPLAAVLALPAWSLDLSDAVLQSVALNGAGALLFAFGLHGALAGRPRTPMHRAHALATPTVMPIVDVVPMQSAEALAFDGLPDRDPDVEANRFCSATFTRPDAGHPEAVRVGDLRSAYRAWAADRGQEPLPDKIIAAALTELFLRAGLSRSGSGADATLNGIAWRRDRLPPARAA